MSQPKSNFFRYSSFSFLGAFAIGGFALFGWAQSTYDRIVLQNHGVTIKGIVESSDSSNSRGIDELWVRYNGIDGASHRAKIYASAHQYSQGQDVLLRALPPRNEPIQIAPGERGDLRRAEIFNMLIAAIFLIPSTMLLIVKLRKQLASTQPTAPESTKY